MDKILIDQIKSLKSSLLLKRNTPLKMVVGFDGFVDEIVHVVAKRQDFKTYTRLSTIQEFGNRILSAAGLSTNIEIVSIQTKCGGNGPILANALIEYGVDMTYIGALGVPDVDSVFKSMSQKSTVYSISNPGHTDALEFDDGKLMFGKQAVIADITWNAIKEKVGGVEKIAQIIKQSDLFGIVNWTMIPHMSDIWENIIKEVFPLLPDIGESKSIVFFDLADPEKRTKNDILHAMELIKAFSQKFKVILGLNEKEIYEISNVFDINIDSSLSNDDKLKCAVTNTYDKLGIYCLVVHPTKSAVACVDGKYFYTVGPYCSKPVLTTGAGDNFNAGFCLGQSLNLDTQQSLLLGVSTSGYYVRNAKSPTIDDVISFLESWENDGIN